MQDADSAPATILGIVSTGPSKKSGHLNASATTKIPHAPLNNLRNPTIGRGSAARAPADTVVVWCGGVDSARRYRVTPASHPTNTPINMALTGESMYSSNIYIE